MKFMYLEMENRLGGVNSYLFQWEDNQIEFFRRLGNAYKSHTLIKIRTLELSELPSPKRRKDKPK